MPRKKNPSAKKTSYNAPKSGSKESGKSRGGNIKDGMGIVKGTRKDGRKFTKDTTKDKRDALTGKYIDKPDVIENAKEKLERNPTEVGTKFAKSPKAKKKISLGKELAKSGTPKLNKLSVIDNLNNLINSKLKSSDIDEVSAEKVPELKEKPKKSTKKPVVETEELTTLRELVADYVIGDIFDKK